MRAAKSWTPFLYLALVVVGLALGGAWTFLLLLALPLTLVALDWALGSEDPESLAGAPLAHRLLPWLYIPAQLAVTIWAGVRISSPACDLAEAIGLTASVGIAGGVFGFLSAHEMIHSRRRAERALGLVMLAALLDMRFAISHVHGHHRLAATYDDPATARRGESLYAFLVRSLVGQARDAWAFEAGRQRRAGNSPFGFGNRVIVYALIETTLTVEVSLASPRALAFFLAQAALAIFLLEAFNYVAHYGLYRKLQPNGRLEPLSPRHSWSTARRMNNAALFNMGRHADHHRFSARPYHQLEILPGSSELPCGYAGVLLMALVPPLWRKVMDPRVDAVMDGDAESSAAWLSQRRARA
jgi:alkane 1-monooxygenase